MQIVIYTSFYVFSLTKYISWAIHEPIVEAVNAADFISIMFDGATDKSVTEVEIIYCR